MHILVALLLVGAGEEAGAKSPIPHQPRSAELRSGRIGSDDYPASALREQAEGTTEIEFLVGEDGRVVACKIRQSSGNRALDSTTCSLAQRRLRFRPAIGADGYPVSERRIHRQTWSLPSEVPPAPGVLPASD
jgi:protein TonB